MKKRVLSLLLAAILSVSALSGCGDKKTVDGKINLTVGGWVSETNPEELERINNKKDEFMNKYTDINIIPDTYTFDTQTFTMKAAAKQLPNLTGVYFTEIEQIIESGYAADITDVVKKWGYDTAMNPSLLELVSDEDGRIYGLPDSVYTLGLVINKKVFREAGLVNDDGTVKVPDTWQEVAEYSKIIKEKTGNAGLVFPTTNNCGGWLFLNIAWGYGTNFVELKDNGKWKAAFDTQEARDALQYMKDLRWKYDALVGDNAIDQGEMNKYFAVGQAGMMIASPSSFGGLVDMYGMNKDDIAIASMPKGPAGRFAQMGGGIHIFSSESTAEQIDAGLKWLEYNHSYTPNLSEERINTLKDNYQNALDKGGIVLPKESTYVWTAPEYKDKIESVMAEYTNVDIKDYEKYFSFEGVEIRPEPGACAQQLYSIMDKCIQEVFTNENADVDGLISGAVKDYQQNHLDKM